jgi:EmrB/QacA subfamily drug resistance transporter
MRAAPPSHELERSEHPWLVLLSVGLGLFMVVIDISILNIALPTIAGAFNASLPEVEWTLIAYTLALTGLVPFFGRISDVLGRKRLFIAGIALFAAASLLASFSQTVTWLIGARLIQAFGGALISANTLAIITDTFPAGQRGTAMGVQAILISGGAAAGPTLGGFLVTRFGWQAVFLVNVPVGVVAAAFAFVILPPLQSHRSLEPVDWPGTALLLGGLGPFLLGVTKSVDWGWDSPATLGLIVVGLVVSALFVWHEQRTPYPLVDLSLFRIREFAAGQAAGVFATLALSTATLLFPFYWQALRGYSAERAGIVMLPLPFAIGLTAPTAGHFSDRIGARWIATGGLAIVCVGLWLISGITATMALPDVLARLAVLGVGIGTFTAPNNNAVMTAAPVHRRGIASGLLGMSRYVGQSLGIAFSGTAFALFAVASSFHLGGLPSPEQLRAVAQHPERLAEFQQAFIAGLHAAALLAIPFAIAGMVLSLMRGAQGTTDAPAPALVGAGSAREGD